MLLFNALTQICSQADSIARRPNGVMLQVTDRMKLLTFNSGKAYRWTPKTRDLLADDWEVISIERLIEETRLIQENAELAQSEETQSNG
jgi:hypothetical protein